MAHYCICPKCNEKFNRDRIQAVKVGARRYGHATCYPDNTDFMPVEEKKEKKKKEKEKEKPSADPDYVALKEYIQKLFNGKQNYVLVEKQIKKFKEEMGYSYSGMMKSLIYFYEVKHNSLEKSNNSIGIVPYVYQDSYNYFYALFLAQQQNMGVEFKKVEKEVQIKRPSKDRKRMKLIDFSTLEGDYEDAE